MFDQHPSDACAAATLLFENAEWRLLGDGLEHRATGYFIAREMIAMRRGDLWEWPLHLSEKRWCTPVGFRQAFLAAVDAFGAGVDASLARSFAVGFGLIAGASAKPTVSTAGIEDFVALGDLVRPKSTSQIVARKRGTGTESRAVNRRAGMPVPQRASDAARQRATL